VWDKLRKQISVELEQLDTLFTVHRPLLTKSLDTPPDEIGLSALAAFLHSFYTGIENIFKRVTLEVDGLPPRGVSWHRELLDAMTRETERRKRVISQDLSDRLKDYLQFRHFFRHAYVFHLQWAKIRPLVVGCEETMRMLRDEIEGFLHNA